MTAATDSLTTGFSLLGATDFFGDVLAAFVVDFPLGGMISFPGDIFLFGELTFDGISFLAESLGVAFVGVAAMEDFGVSLAFDAAGVLLSFFFVSVPSGVSSVFRFLVGSGEAMPFFLAYCR